MTNFSRRSFTKLLGATGAATLATPWISRSSHAASARIVVIGGGFGGATAAKYAKRFDSAVSVTLIEPSTQFFTCPFSNTVIGGMNNMDYIAQDYAALKASGVEMIHDYATLIDSTKKTVRLAKGSTVSYDRLIVSPGIDFKWGAIEGFSEDLAQKIPHAWKAGPQTMLLRKQLEAMPDGGTFILSPPPNPFRCPPGPGERISLVANYFKTHKPKSKILVLDPKKKFSKQGLFTEGWAKLYPGMIEYRNLDNDGLVRAIDTGNMKLITDFEEHTADVINLIPAQKAGKIAQSSGLADKTGWCPVDQRTFESKLISDVHVIGDSAMASPMPKSGFAASTQAKVCAAAVTQLLKGQTPETPKFVNTCYSLVAPDYGISVAMVYGYENDKIVKIKGSGGLSPSDAGDSFRAQEARYAEGWYESIAKDIWG